MASRRILPSALRLLAAPAARPVAKPLLSTTTRAQFVSRPATTLGARVAVGKRWYSTEDTVPGSKIWEFDEIKRIVEDKEAAQNVVVVDVREPVELFETGKIPGAINIPVTSAVQSFHISEDDFEDLYGFARPPKDAELMFYCKAGVRARAAAGLAKHAGWENVGEYPGSWLDWEKKGGPVEPVEGTGKK